LEKANSFFEKGMSFLEGEKPNPKKASAFFLKAWKKYEALTEWDKVYETLDKLAQCYHMLKKPRVALIYLERKHDLKNKFKDHKGAIMANVEMARMFAEYKSGKDEALDFYQRAWKENIKYAVGGELNNLIPKEVADVLKSIGKTDEFIEKYIKEHFK